jgi:hypothetical protein
MVVNLQVSKCLVCFLKWKISSNQKLLFEFVDYYYDSNQHCCDNYQDYCCFLVSILAEYILFIKL